MSLYVTKDLNLLSEDMLIPIMQVILIKGNPLRAMCLQLQEEL